MLLISQKAFLNSEGQAHMSSLSKNLSDEDRFFLYTINKKKNGAISLVLNLLLFSLESWIQGDYTGALIQDGLYITGAIMMVLGWETYTTGYYYTYTYTEPTDLFYAGNGFVVGAWITGLVTPFVYQNRWNSKLGTGLNTYVAFFEPNFKRIASYTREEFVCP